MKTIIRIAALFGAGLVASNANATLLDFTYTTGFGTPVSANFQIDIADTANVLGGYTVQSVAGTVNGQAVALTPYTQTFPVSSVGNYVFNDTIYKVGSSYFLSVSGMLVQTASAYYNFGEGGFADYAVRSTTPSSIARASIGSYTLHLAATPVAPAAVPEPASWAMMVGGFGLLGAALRSNRRRGTAAIRLRA
ncbi:PEPxxWA-CTERM sorting domain-containing protein [Sphingomonas sp. BIUV-7]|uniref:PEPxxWA-CTERM sorting domain-containing protein n=1 Tax=Sphingomonas natans TaxID=3063330 RepID=A0ABT8YBS9_9SPHN|nr:PEPxxWA-CTERM sorting domain-containing protein [Sphingomonas sp. BIUV-7]MDO6415786.1 PEPxxWA-CTERM sorting domain-containing protein [Sphingomonas sp. BIUV-7]